MNLRKILFTLYLLSFCTDNIFCQDYINTSQTDAINANDSCDSSSVMFNIHLGFGIINGGRIGALMKISDEVSFEAAYGNDFRNFLAASDEVIQYTIGVNWQCFESSNFTASLLMTYHDRVLFDSDMISLSPTIGFMNLREKYLRLFIRAGFGVKVCDVNNKEFTENWIYPNLDIGINWNF